MHIEMYMKRDRKNIGTGISVTSEFKIYKHNLTNRIITKIDTIRMGSVAQENYLLLLPRILVPCAVISNTVL
jgi:hypothetical protein